MLNYYLIAFGAVLLTAVSQILMKLGARSAESVTWRLYLNGYTLTAYASLVMVTLLNLYAFRHIPLKAAVVLLPLTLVLVVFFSVLLLHERLTRQQIVGSIVILFGLAIFNL